MQKLLKKNITVRNTIICDNGLHVLPGRQGKLLVQSDAEAKVEFFDCTCGYITALVKPEDIENES